MIYQNYDIHNDFPKQRLTGVLGVDGEIAQFIDGSVTKTFSGRLDALGVANLFVANRYLERGVRDVFTILGDVHEMFTDLTGRERNTFRRKYHLQKDETNHLLIHSFIHSFMNIN